MADWRDPLWKYDPKTDVMATFRRHGLKPTTKAERERRQIEKYGDKRGRIVPEQEHTEAA